MKRKFLNSSMELITKNKHYTDDEIAIMAYGLEAIYLTVTKRIVIFALAIILGIFREVILLLIFYNIIRSQAFGIHASKSIYCLVASIVMFIGGALICKYVILPVSIMILCAVICNICLFLYAPADTYKRPLVNEKKRKRFKVISSLLGIAYTALIILFRDYYIANYLLIGMVEAVIIILPITYKLFKLPYNNYKTYNYGV